MAPSKLQMLGKFNELSSLEEKSKNICSEREELPHREANGCGVVQAGE